MRDDAHNLRFGGVPARLIYDAPKGSKMGDNLWAVVDAFIYYPV
jgi:hypothetical protein